MTERMTTDKLMTIALATTLMMSGACYADISTSSDVQSTDFITQDPLSWSLRAAIGGIDEGDLDLGSKSGGNVRELYADFRPTLELFLNDSWQGRLEAQVFLPTGEVLVDSENAASASNEFLGLRQFWLQYSGFTEYPGEYFRIGKQRVKSDGGLWWDQDIETINWVFDTTTLTYQMGVAEAFDTYRTDDSEVRDDLENRTFVFANLSKKLDIKHTLNLHMSYAKDHEDAVAGQVFLNEKVNPGQYFWLGVSVDREYYLAQQEGALAYWMELSYLTGEEDSITLDVNDQVVSVNNSDVNAWSGNVGLRYRLPTVMPINVGVAYAIAQGGLDSDESTTYRQTGMQSNRSRYTGTRATFHRFSESLRADFSNLEASSLFFSIPKEQWDASLVFHHLGKNARDSGISALGTTASANGNGKKLGVGLDVVFSYYDLGGISNLSWLEEESSYLRLRASVFKPGNAYTADARDTLHRVIAEWVMRF